MSVTAASTTTTTTTAPTTTTTLGPQPVLDLVADIIGDLPDPVDTGGVTTYTVQVSNLGPGDASAVTLVSSMVGGK